MQGHLTKTCGAVNRQEDAGTDEQRHRSWLDDLAFPRHLFSELFSHSCTCNSLFLCFCDLAQEHVFALGNRIEVLEQINSPAVVPHIADAQGKRFLYEAIFR